MAELDKPSPPLAPDPSKRGWCEPPCPLYCQCACHDEEPAP